MKTPKLHQKVAAYGPGFCRGKPYGNSRTRWEGRIRWMGTGSEILALETRTHMMVIVNRRQCVAMRSGKASR